MNRNRADGVRFKTLKNPALFGLWVLLSLTLATPVRAGELKHDDISAFLEPLRAKFDLPALAVAVLKTGKLEAIGAVGVRKFGANAPVTLDDRFHLGSCTKAITATLIAKLVEDKKLT